MDNILEGFNVNGDFFDEINKLHDLRLEKNEKKKFLPTDMTYINRFTNLPPEEQFIEYSVKTNENHIASLLEHLKEIKDNNLEGKVFDAIVQCVKQYIIYTVYEPDNIKEKSERCVKATRDSYLLWNVLFGASNNRSDLVLFP